MHDWTQDYVAKYLKFDFSKYTSIDDNTKFFEYLKMCKYNFMLYIYICIYFILLQ